MRQLITSEQAKQLDQRSQQFEGISSEVLMERAGQVTAMQILTDFGDAKNVVLVIGPGNNGGDGLVIARTLLGQKRNMTLVCPTEGVSDLWKKKKAELLNFNSKCQWIGTDELVSFIENANDKHWDLFVDAAFGVGMSRPLNSLWIRTLQALSECSKSTVAVDIPSGLDGTTGLAFDGTIKADITYTMGFAKLGMLIGDGAAKSGRIKVMKIGFSKAVAKQLLPAIFYFGKQEAIEALPKKADWRINKARRGHLLVIAGSEGMEGAGALAAMAGARMGSGYVTWARWPQKQGHSIGVPPHVLTATLDDDLSFLNKIKEPSAIVIGPGLGINDQSRNLIKNIYKRFKKRSVVIDADALHLLKLEGLYPVPSQWILTPHVGELARLLDLEPEHINQNRFEVLSGAQNVIGGSILLKGYRSLIIDAEGKVWVIGAGGPVLAKAGTGDVLAGMIGGLLAQQISPSEALCLGTYLHGKMGDLYVKEWKNDISLIATDLIDLIPNVLRGLNAQK